MKTIWTKTKPTEEGWLWVRYTGKHGKLSCPAYVTILKDKAVCVNSARNDFFVDYNDGNGFFVNGKKEKNLYFGPKIEIPGE